MGRRLGPPLHRMRGDTSLHYLHYLVDGAAVDITGFSFLMTLNTSESPVGGTPAPTVQFTGSVVVAAEGKFSIGPANATEADQAVDTVFYYDLQITDAAGRLHTVWKNTYTFTQDVTK